MPKELNKLLIPSFDPERAVDFITRRREALDGLARVAVDSEGPKPVVDNGEEIVVESVEADQQND